MDTLPTMRTPVVRKSNAAGEYATVEAEIVTQILTAARKRAAKQGREITGVARNILVKASKAAKLKPGVAHPANRPAQAARQRLRFRMDPEAYDVIKKRIRASGQSMTAALESGLEHYARTGEI